MIGSIIEEVKKEAAEPLQDIQKGVQGVMEEAKAAIDKAMKEAGQKPYWTNSADVDEGWSFAYMGTDHDVDGVTVSLSITNVVKFEKTEAETQAVFEKERRARARHSKMMFAFDAAMPCASASERLAYRKRLSEEYYKED